MAFLFYATLGIPAVFGVLGGVGLATLSVAAVGRTIGSTMGWCEPFSLSSWGFDEEARQRQERLNERTSRMDFSCPPRGYSYYYDSKNDRHYYNT